MYNRAIGFEVEVSSESTFRMSGHSMLLLIWKRTLCNPHPYLSSRGRKMPLFW